MNKKESVAFLKEHGLGISVATLDRHRKEGRVVANDVPSKTGHSKDYSEEALRAYLETEQIRVPSIDIDPAKPSQPETSQALVKATHQSLQRTTRTTEATDEPFQPLAKALLEVHQIASRNVWTIDEAVSATGVSKGTLKAAVKEKKIRGGLDGGKIKVNAADARRFADEMFSELA